MKDKLIQSFPIPWLEHVFLPPGMLLVTKAANQPETTSLLVRGGAGTGKTTLAVAVAHAIAREQEGVALYLTTEFVPTELAYKARLLGLPEGSVAAWRSAPKELKPGSILAEHLQRTDAGAEVMTSAERKRAALNAVAEVLFGKTGELPAERKQELPVRAVVIDAFGLPESGGEGDERALRGELLALMQALEVEGISTIVVEEAASAADPWLPFVVDIVFELELQTDPDTGALLRKLMCPKSRYKPVLPGPHDYGLENGKPCVWPDVLPGGSGVVSSTSMVAPAPRMFMPLDNGQGYAVCPGGTVLFSAVEEAAPVIDAFGATPGIRIAWVDCGPLTSIMVPEGPTVSVPETRAGSAIMWSLLRARDAGVINAVVFQNMRYFLQRLRLRVGALQMVAMLSAAGLLVCIHDMRDGGDLLMPVVHYVDGGHRSGKIARKPPPRRPRSAVRWLPPQARASTSAGEGRVRSFIRMFIQRMMSDSPEPSALQDQLTEDLSPLDKSWLAWAFHLLGSDSTADELLAEIRGWEEEPLVALAARTEAARGNELAAAWSCLSSSLPINLYAELWRDISAIYARNEFALSKLYFLANEKSVFRTALLRALAVRNRMEEVEDLLARIHQQNREVPDWLIERARADLCLESTAPGRWIEATAKLETLANSEALPAIHRAEVFYNLGVVRERLGELGGALAAYQQAVETNVHLDAARRAVEQLRLRV